MSKQDLPQHECSSEGEDEDEDTHPLKAGIEAAKNGETASLDDILSQLH